MSDSEDDFMSDKFLVDAPPPEPLNYSARRAKESLKSQRLGQAKNQLKLKDLEEQRRKEGLETSLFERLGDGRGKSKDREEAREAEKGGNKAMEMMMKMGWKVGEGLGKKRSPSPPLHLASSSRGGIGSKRPRLDDGHGHEDEEEEKGQEHQEGLKGKREHESTHPRTEPIRISLWARRKGLSARSPSPPPLPLNTANRNPDALDTAKMEQLGRATEGFRDRQRVEWAEKERERKGKKARELLVEMDREKGVKFHPLHVFPSDPLGTLPRPLFKLIYPSQLDFLSPSPSSSPSPSLPKLSSFGKEENISAAERLREQMRRDMLTDLDLGLDQGGDEGEEGEGMVRFGVEDSRVERLQREGEGGEHDHKEEVDYKDVDWEEMVPGTKRVLSMDPATYVTFTVDQLRHEHLFCFWCAYKYKSYEEMEGPGGCPGEEEDDH
ncbi:hypothetical protein C343_04463 [Cryptococcus neoformans C23]|uniref:G-patch domain-containing protein n=1 Tax=Cryptococcus neoformans (strain H99 / ATCC 208821 / CBS 10515 / FGSC 9487) TaxID=235443 RepID=J9VQ09_CRYN9|nr:hypothetical protein CNAG_03118 [Cryptococcus neoformans var. grubii H99]AUB26249.1 hypothetical protein CKF44_03118 [Cryptococcus neoformans var. grubii]OWZ30229.1 hypothetical protein C347_04510 [Cryptococcus neoformans var. grubii AD2-60a]OWZ41948.1 hypothetical protein C343_04463 [Cryptococcus neoformans var. grubii C23]OWZ52972.1 hypothetical protein C368_04536 [Cryptococcus neoformans var. grubii 125.91]OXG29985.1 hypothetical protein C360_05194 [Cryptococcus neoformans var. grubii Bt|eukprot:XP_012051036.1 hypothetical protein CNAG_03118 [Cryptococcus neoformans var. grubii H99]